MSEARQRLEIHVNGEPRSVREGDTIGDLVSALGFDQRAVAVERNGSIVKRELGDEVVLEAGDHLEIVRFVQGGCSCRREAL